MLIKIDFQSEIPIYQQLKNEIIIGMAKKELVAGEALPSVRQLASDLGVNLHTINKAYNQLKAEGYVAVDRRKGATIAPLASKPTDGDLDTLKSELQLLLATSICKGIDQDSINTITAQLFETFKEDL